MSPRRLSASSVLIVLLGVVGLQAASVQRGDIVFQSSFDTPAEREAWSEAPYTTWEPDSGHEQTTALRVTVPTSAAKGGHLTSTDLDLTRWRGCRLRLTCQARAEAVTQPAQAYLGVKYMLHYRSATEGAIWRNQNDIHGTFDWRRLGFEVSIADDAEQGQLALGLQGSSGTVWFDELSIEVINPPRPRPPASVGPVFRGHQLPRLRGVMSPNTFREEDLRVLGQEWNANVIRWQITRNWGQAGTDRDIAEYERWFRLELADLDRALDACLRYGILVVIDLHSPPGGRYENMDMAIFHEPLYQDLFVSLWERMARRYQGHPAVWGYDLVNEPEQNDLSPEGVADWLGTQERAARAIRAIDPDRPIFVAACEWDSAPGFRYLEPLDIPDLIYQVHMYHPHAFTHQGVHGKPMAIPFPGTIDGVFYDKEVLRRHLAPVREFQQAYNVHIYVGEFSAIRWAPGDSAYRYLKACIELFEEYGWDWSYHAYREWDGWSVEHGSDPNDHRPATRETDRKRLLRQWFARNQKPAFGEPKKER